MSVYTSIAQRCFLNTQAALVQIPPGALETVRPIERGVHERLQALVGEGDLSYARIDFLKEKPGAPVVVGRTDPADLEIDVKSISKEHVQFRRTLGNWRVTDLDSGNGTFLDGARVPAGVPTPIQSGQILGLASYRCMLLEPDHLRVLARLLDEPGKRDLEGTAKLSTVQATLVMPAVGFKWQDLTEALVAGQAGEDVGSPFFVQLPDGVLEEPSPLREESQVTDRLRVLQRSGGLPPAMVHRVVPRQVDGPVGIGRLPRLSELVLEVAEVSRRHAELRQTGSGDWVLVDLESGNGSFIDEQRCPAGIPTPVRSGQVLRFSSYRCLFLEPKHVYALAALSVARARLKDSGEIVLMNKILETPPEGLPLKSLVQTVSGFTQEEFIAYCHAHFMLEIPMEPVRSKQPPAGDMDGTVAISEEEIKQLKRSARVKEAKVHTIPPHEKGAILGRASEGCDVIVGEDQVSKQHARIQRRKDGWYVVDLGSRNGTYLDAERLTPGVPMLLRDGANLSFSNHRALWLSPTRLHSLAAEVQRKRRRAEGG